MAYLRTSHALRASAVLAAAAWAAGPALAIVGGTSTSAFPAVATGVQVTPNWVVTVQHAALNVGDFYTNGYGTRQVVGRFDAPGSGNFPANDVALLLLAPTLASIPYLPVASNSFASGSMPPMPVTITSALNTSGDGQPRAYGFTSITEFAPQITENSITYTTNYLLSYDTTVRVQGGDSGGGLFYGQVTNATSPLLGLSSALLEDDKLVPIGSGFVLLSAYRSWIDTTMAANGGQAIQWVTAVPEPATWALWSAGLLALAAAARRRAGRADLAEA